MPAAVREPRKLPVILSPEEVARVLDAAPGLKYRAALSVAYGAGLRASEVVSLKLADIDSSRRVIRVEQSKGRKDRYATLDDNGVTFKWKDYRAQGRERYKTMALPIPEFIRRFLSGAEAQGGPHAQA